MSAALRRFADAGELPPSATTRLANALRAGVLGIQARARAGETGDAITMLDGFQALLPQARRRARSHQAQADLSA